jgi:tetratricopeptide (TPR) repeat protein
MTIAEENMFLEAQKAIESGDKARGKDLLTRLLKQNQQNPDYWLWMSAVVDSEKERRYCLNQTLKLDPKNEMARRGQILMGDLPVDPALVFPFEQQKRKWQLPPISTNEKPLPKIPWLKVALTSFALLAVITVIVVALGSDRLWTYRSRNLAAMGTAVPTPTYPASATPTITETPRITGPTAPWNILRSTYTPTPIYVYTPHPIVEAFSIAMRNYQEQDWEETIKYLKQAIQTQPDAPDLHYHLGEVYLQTGDIENALIAFEKSIETDPDFAAGYYGRAKLRISNEDTFSDAIDDLLQCIDLDPEYGEAYLSLLNAYIKVGDNEKAREVSEQVEKLLPYSPFFDLSKGRLALLEGEYKLATDHTEAALEKDLTLLPAYKLLGEIYQASGNPKESLEPLLIYHRYNTTQDRQDEILLSVAYAANNQFEEALQLLDNILERDSRYAKGFIQRGTIYTQMEEYEKAIDDYERASKLESKSFEYCMLFSEAFFPMEKPGNAYQQAGECQKLAETDHELARMYFVKAIALEALENDVAKLDWERMLELDPEAILPEWKATALAYLETYYTPTPTSSPTLTATKTITPKTTASKTPTPKITFTITAPGD